MTTDSRFIVAIGQDGQRQEWQQDDLYGTTEQAEQYLDSIRQQIVPDNDDQSRDARLQTAMSIFEMCEKQGWEHPMAHQLVSSVGSALHLMLDTKVHDCVVIDLQSKTIGLTKGGIAA